jgi:serine/threonine-protein kinase
MKGCMAVSLETEATERAWGDAISGKYRVERVLGEGGMGVILEATHLQLDERVAIKMLRADLSRDEETVQRFLREAKAAIKIRSEHVVRVYDVSALDSGTPYIVMELLTGTDLDRLVKERGPVPPSDAVDYVLQACEALAEAHALGMVHRDLKPANLFLTHRKDGTPCVKVLDFGITKLAAPPGTNDLGITTTQAIFGSPKYMSPEQMRSSREVDARSDIWSLGTILYELLSGQAPFVAETMPSLCAMVLNDPPPPLPVAIPDALAAVVLRCLRKNPDHRFLDVGELAQALAPLGSSHALVSRTRIVGVLSQSDSQLQVRRPSSPSLPDAPSGAKGAGVTSSSWGGASAAIPKTRAFATIAGVAAVALAIGLAAYFVGASTRGARAPEKAAAAPPATAHGPVVPPVEPLTPNLDPPGVATAKAPATTTAPEPARPAPHAAVRPGAGRNAGEPPPAQTFAPVATASPTATAIPTATATPTATPPPTAAAPATPTPTTAKPSGAELFNERK